MATDLLPADVEESPPRERPGSEQPQSSFRATVEPFLRPVASLKLTVSLFGLAIFLVFAGTLAQAHHDVWWVLHHYFRALFAWIEFQVFFPPAWFPGLQSVAGGFWFSGGFLIGGLMMINLLAAHGLRFKVQAKGVRLWSGLGAIGLGCAITWLIIGAGPGEDGSQATMPFGWKTIWQMFLMGLAIASVGIAGALFVLDQNRKAERTILMGAGTLLLALLAVLLFVVDASSINSDSMLSSMRILWQVIQGGFAALVLLAGCIMVFRKRAGIVLLHSGVLLLMANELVVHLLHKESTMRIAERDTANYSIDARTFELAVIDPDYSETEDEVVVVPEEILRNGLAENQPISRPNLLPFDIQIEKLFENADFRKAKSADEAVADRGVGREAVLAPQPLVTGTDTDKHNYPGAYVKLLDKSSGKPLGTFLLSTMLRRGDVVEVGGKKYEVALRFERDYKPYTMELLDVRADMYAGTGIPQNYSSQLRLVDPVRDTDRHVKIRMNEPWRYGGETFYQSEFAPASVETEGKEMTTLQVVSNFGWMIPYMACMIVGVGLLAQFSLVLVRFLRRRETPTAAKLPRAKQIPAASSARGWALPIALVLATVGLLVYLAIPRGTAPEKMNLAAFGELPVMSGGRVQPVDTLARNTLRMISLREVYVDAKDNHPSAIKRLFELDEYHPAVRWFLDAIARPDVAEQHRVFRIENPDVLATLGLDRRKYYRYSYAELQPGLKAFDKEMKRLREQDDGQLKVYDKKLVELNNRINLNELLRSAFLHRPLPSLEELKADPENLQAKIELIERAIAAVPQFEQRMKDITAPLAVPMLDAKVANGKAQVAEEVLAWETYPVAWLKAYRPQMKNLILPNEAKEPVNPAVVAWETILDAYKDQDAAKFNRAVADYAALIGELSPAQFNDANPGFESWFNAWGPFTVCQWLYFTAFCFAALAWLGWSGPLNRTAFWLIAVTFVAHTLALCFRMYISGRPPVTNLYSSAIFIGWAGVLAGLILERVYRLGFGNVLASVAGFSTLIIADKLSLVYDSTTRGDTVGVMQAVLDTQFWLATHVTCITLGYTATLVAGLLGLIYIVRGVFTPSLTAEEGKSLARMIYGTVCFGIFFSFVGTVLGGLWADDSWGRFWGWDPKENGALIIVLWNALILHARWDGLVKERGLAVLAIGGNIVTSWSWFGVNQLGVGLHSYGFTEGVLLALGVFCLSQLAMIGIGLAPLKYWASNRHATVT